ncbi:hypothetical protein HK101_005024 [Irineochytrium annulatum]|nr:hypothetical protein HK101_005024 [Irineochytrium annulatum]
MLIHVLLLLATITLVYVRLKDASVLQPVRNSTSVPTSFDSGAKVPSTGGCTPFKSIMTIVLNQADASSVLQEFYFGLVLPSKGYLLTNYTAVGNGSQSNMIGMISGSTFGVNENSTTLEESSIVDLLEKKGYSWKAYFENYPGSCSSVWTHSVQNTTYSRERNPFISFDPIASDPKRCANILNASQLDAQGGSLPSLIYYVPAMRTGGVKTSAVTASSWLQSFLEPKLVQPKYNEVKIGAVGTS